MAFRIRRPEASGGQPGLTPIDDVEAANHSSRFDPDSTTGRLPSQDDQATGSGKKRRSMSRKRRKSA